MQKQEPLVPDRHVQHDIFICNFFGASPKDDWHSMEHPMFSLSTKPDHRIRYYEHNGNTVTIAPGAYGLATIMDKDILIFCISQIVAAINQGREPSRTVRLTAHNLLVFTNRLTDGDSYERLKAAFDRLATTYITTSIETGGKRIDEGFGIIDRWKIVRETASGRMEAVEVTLSEWLYNAVLGKEVLTISRDYFRLRKPTERRLESLDTIDNFSLNRIISLCDHSIYRDGRRFAVYRWGVAPKQIEEQGICPKKAKKSHGKS
jgi:plasmid replication initiation protein